MTAFKRALALWVRRTVDGSVHQFEILIRLGPRSADREVSPDADPSSLISDETPTEDPVYIRHRADGSHHIVADDDEPIVSDELPDENPFAVSDFPALAAVIDFVDRLDVGQHPDTIEALRSALDAMIPPGSATAAQSSSAPEEVPAPTSLERRMQLRILKWALVVLIIAEMGGILGWLIHPAIDIRAYSGGVLVPVLMAVLGLAARFFRGRRRKGTGHRS